MQKKNLLVIGHKQHGKDTVIDVLRDQFGYTTVNASLDVIAPKIIMPRSDVKYATAQDCYEDRVNWRLLWGELIEQYNTPDGAAVAKEVMKISDVYGGIRRRAEFEVAKHLFDAIIWVDRSLHMPPEDAETMHLSAMDATHFIDNNGDLASLEGKVFNLLQELQDAKSK